MTRSNKQRSPAFGLLIGIGLGVLVALIFKKIAIGILLAIVISLILYKVDKSSQ